MMKYNETNSSIVKQDGTYHIVADDGIVMKTDSLEELANYCVDNQIEPAPDCFYRDNGPLYKDFWNIVVKGESSNIIEFANHLNMLVEKSGSTRHDFRFIEGARAHLFYNDLKRDAWCIETAGRG